MLWVLVFAPLRVYPLIFPFWWSYRLSCVHHKSKFVGGETTISALKRLDLPIDFPELTGSFLEDGGVVSQSNPSLSMWETQTCESYLVMVFPRIKHRTFAINIEM